MRVPLGKSSGLWEASFIRESSLPSWLSKTGGTTTHSGINGGAGELQVEASNEVVEVTGPSFNSSEFTGARLLITGRTNFTAEHGILLGIRDSGINNGVSVFDKIGDVADLSLYDNGGSDSFRTDYSHIQYNRFTLELVADYQAQEVYTAISDGQITALQSGSIGDDSVRPVIKIDTTTNGTTESLWLTEVEFELFRN